MRTLTVSVTEVQSFKRCRRQWDYGSFNRQGLTPIMQPKPYLDLGTLVHKTLAFWKQVPDLGKHTLEGVFLTLAHQHRTSAIDTYIRATGQQPTSEQLEPLMDAIATGSAMMYNYQTYYGTPMPEHLRFCAPEQEIIIPIPGTEHPCPDCTNAPGRRSFPCNSCGGTGVAYHKLKARLDALTQDTEDNLYVVEHKTYDKRPELALLEATDQFIGYMWTAQQMALEMPGQPPVVGIAYDGMWKRATPPSRPKQLTMADLFVRTIITPAQDEVEEYGRELAETVMDMANSPRLYKNRQWQGCWDCSFEHLCRTQSQNGDVDFVLRTMFTQRREDDTQDIVAAVDAQPLIGV